MKCFSCGKNFEYDKYYGICPKCGCYNKRETSEETHQSMHDVYDGGYTHSEHTHGSQVSEPKVRKKMQGSSKFLLVSVLLFAFILIAGTAFAMIFEALVTIKMQAELTELTVEETMHDPGESFLFQEMQLRVEDAKVLADDQSLNLPEGKKLIAVKLAGFSDGTYEAYNELSEAYISTSQGYYQQISYYEFEPYGEIYGYHAFDPYELSGSKEAEGWIAFLIDKEEMQFDLCLEERCGEELLYLERIHRIPVSLKEEG